MAKLWDTKASMDTLLWLIENPPKDNFDLWYSNSGKHPVDQYADESKQIMLDSYDKIRDLLWMQWLKKEAEMWDGLSDWEKSALLAKTLWVDVAAWIPTMLISASQTLWSPAVAAVNWYDTLIDNIKTAIYQAKLNAASNKVSKDADELIKETAAKRWDSDLIIAKNILKNYQKWDELNDWDLELLMKNYIPLLQSSDKETSRLLNRLLWDKHRIPYDILWSTDASNDIFWNFKKKINNIWNEIRRVQLNNDGLKIMDDNLTREVNDPKLGSRKEYNFNDKDRKDLEKIEDELWNTYWLLPDKDYSHIIKKEIKKWTKKDQYRWK